MLEMVFVLDTTGSMASLIDGAKQRIWGIVNEVMQSSSRPNVRIGLVGYRDRGDEYVTTLLPLTNDLDKVYTTLMGYRAVGGGDLPEDVRRALAEGVRNAGWSPTQSSPRMAQILFLVGDAPPHDDYQDQPDTVSTAAEAAQNGIVVNAIQCGEISGTGEKWQKIARVGQGEYFSIAQHGNVQVISTPYDEQLGKLAEKLGGTYLAYGGGAGAGGERFRRVAKEVAARAESEIAASAGSEAKADRATNKVLNATAYVGDLLQDLENGSKKLDAVKDEDLPSELRSLSAAQRSQEIDKRLAERKSLRAEIIALSKQRQEFIESERRNSGGSNEQGFDGAVAAALKEQLARKGIR
jgi:hypothetical protein